jgi:hypothetical protein
VSVANIYVHPPTVLGLLRDIKSLWDREGFGTDKDQSERLYERLTRALEDLEDAMRLAEAYELARQ